MIKILVYQTFGYAVESQYSRDVMACHSVGLMSERESEQTASPTCQYCRDRLRSHRQPSLTCFIDGALSQWLCLKAPSHD